MIPFAVQAPAIHELLVLLEVVVKFLVVILIAGAAAWLLDRWDEWRNRPRGPVPPLTRDQLADRGVPVWPRDQKSPPWPHDLASWEDLSRPDGQVVR